MRFLALDQDDPAFNWRTLRFPADLPRLKTMTEILSPLDAEPGAIQEAGRQDDHLPRVGRSGDQRLRHDRLLTSEWRRRSAARREADAFLRLYLVPGMHHCSGGPGPNSFDMLPALEDWVEKGVAPAAIVASADRPTARSCARGRSARIRRSHATPAPAASTMPRTSGAKRSADGRRADAVARLYAGPMSTRLRVLSASFARCAFCVLCLSAEIAGADWPQFSGPTGQGHSTERGLPLEWSESRNVVWKTPVPGKGWSSPVVAGDRVWLRRRPTEGGGRSLRLLAFDRESGGK